MKPDIAKAQRGPSDETGDSTEVQQPLECLRRASGPQTEVRQGPEEPGRDDRDIRDAVLGRAAEDLRELPIRRHGDEDAGADPAVAVAGRPGRDQDAGVHDRGQGWDPRVLDRDDPRRGVGVAGAGDERRVLRGDDQADEQRAEDVEEGDAVGDGLGGAGDRAMRFTDSAAPMTTVSMPM
ncbi:AAT family amino acid transporter [Teratosphaeria destructans]|uniref:AAT family amino acid transporter n=1 Tax=Teratosphaeria destructans TaxID=418781 RepID=A0A9W7T2A2_9PEZI|nr:AAT family amino acid transporter [Teratosphaeria destructans]